MLSLGVGRPMNKIWVGNVNTLVSCISALGRCCVILRDNQTALWEGPGPGDVTLSKPYNLSIGQFSLISLPHLPHIQ